MTKRMIPRENQKQTGSLRKATSNICTNPGLCALAFTIHMTLLGEKGLGRVAALNHEAACKTADALAAIAASGMKLPEAVMAHINSPAADAPHPDDPKFVRNEVHRPRPMKLDHALGTFIPDPEAQGYYEVKTWWRTLDDCVEWTRSPAFAEAHRNRAPKEMFRGPNVLEIHEVLTSTDLDLADTASS